MRNSKIALFAIAACFFAAGCSNKKASAPDIQTADSKAGNSEVMEISTWGQADQKLPESFVFPQAEYTLEKDFFPWTGTVSHHFITDPLIDDWFRQIAERRTVETFFIICPSHFGLSTFDYSIASCKWNCDHGNYVYCNQEKSEELKKALGVEYDNQVFLIEHGAATLMPYISKYFPKADVVVVAINGEVPENIKYAETLADGIKPYFDEAGKKENFLLISTDFSHHGTAEETERKDKSSLEFLNNPILPKFTFAVCDNKSGIYVLSSCLKPEDKVHILYHTNSFEISAQDADDITSYFFTLFG